MFYNIFSDAYVLFPGYIQWVDDRWRTFVHALIIKIIKLLHIRIIYLNINIIALHWSMGGGGIDCDCNKSQKNFNFIPFIMKRIRDPTALHHDNSGSWY